MTRTYKELSEQYKITHGDENTNKDDFDIIVKPLTPGHATERYKIIKCPSTVTTEELVKICGSGGHNFGHRWEGDTLVIYTD